MAAFQKNLAQKDKLDLLHLGSVGAITKRYYPRERTQTHLSASGPRRL
jgi:hypothetical protein